MALNRALYPMSNRPSQVGCPSSETKVKTLTKQGACFISLLEYYNPLASEVRTARRAYRGHIWP